jgi:Transglycosylase-like domain
MKRMLISLAAIVSLTGCTMEQLNSFVRWHERDPQGATEFANIPAIKALWYIEPPHAVPVEYHYTKWDAIAYCESGGNWHLRAHNRTGSYGGGLMIRDNVWRNYGGTQFAWTADQASRDEQIIVAERIRSDVGLRAWDCAR